MRRFRGESTHKVDKKGRVSIPAPFRRIIEDGDIDKDEESNASCVLVYGRKGRNCLEGYSIDSIEEVDELISKLPRYSRNREIFLMNYGHSIEGLNTSNSRAMEDGALFVIILTFVRYSLHSDGIEGIVSVC